jgi:DNA invertase Pin-like site-specific DNA recombinase
VQLRRLRDRLREAKAEWHDIVESLERQRTTVRALARSIDTETAQILHANRDPASGTAADAVAEIQRQLDADRQAYDRALRSYDLARATAEHARARLHREMSRLREDIRARER